MHIILKTVISIFGKKRISMGNMFMLNECSKEKWRITHPQLQWTPEFKNVLIEEIKHIPTFRSVKPSIMLAGPISAGKSSLVNTFISAGKKQIVQKAKAGKDERSLTFKYTRYDAVGHLQHRFRLCDTMGILDKIDRGITAHDMVSVIRGHVAPGYKFDATNDIQPSDDKYVENPSEKDISHCLVIVLSAVDVKFYQHDAIDYRKKVMNAIRASREEDIPTYIVLTKVDGICDTLKKDNSKIFTCIHVRDIVKFTSDLFGLPEGYIFPVINYTSHVTNYGADAIEIVALLTLKTLLQSSSDFLEGTEFS